MKNLQEQIKRINMISNYKVGVVINEQLEDSLTEIHQEPVVDDKNWKRVIGYGFQEGQSTWPADQRQDVIENLKDYIEPFIGTIQKFQNDDKNKLPKFISIYVGTSSTGSDKTNAKVAKARMETLTNIVLDTFKALNVREDVAYKLITQSNETYTPAKVDANFYDTKKLEPNAFDRRCYIVINPLKTVGGTDEELDRKKAKMVNASGLFDVDEKGIVDVICSLGGYTDLVDINRKLQNEGGLETFINMYITSGILPFGVDDDAKERNQIVECINDKSNLSGKGNIATVRNDEVVIMWK